jgi:alpha-tubulin suppressor-like RCC1 family protein
MPTTNFKNSSGTDIGNTLVEKSYLIDRYPELADTFKQAGLWAWGSNFFKQLGDGTDTTRNSPVQTTASGTNWKEIYAAGQFFSAGIKTDGTLWMWGYNPNGQLGTGTSSDTISTPVQTIAAGTNWKMVSCGGYHTAAIKTDGTLWGWGKNLSGHLGDGTTTSRTSPVQTIVGGTNWKMVSAGQNFTGAIKTDGTLWMWGYGFDGELGVGAQALISTPVQTVAAGTNWKQISCSGIAGTAAAIKTDGTLWMWGLNTSGELGDGTTTRKSSPVQTVAGGNNWKFVSTQGKQATRAIKTDGTLWTWGLNDYGQLGDGTTTSRSSPVQTVAAGTNWKIVCSGRNSTLAIKTDGSLWSWGIMQGFAGVSSPTQQIDTNTNWKMISCGAYANHFLSIRDDSADIFGNTL